MSKPTSKQALYSMTSAKAKKAIKRLGELIDSKNESVALGACKTILNKTLPDIKTLELERVDSIEGEIKSKTIEEAKRLKGLKTGDMLIDMRTMDVDEAKQIIRAS